MIKVNCGSYTERHAVALLTLLTSGEHKGGLEANGRFPVLCQNKAEAQDR
jgi:hypothetical protein